jgi:hypothetical protein
MASFRVDVIRARMFSLPTVSISTLLSSHTARGGRPAHRHFPAPGRLTLTLGEG